MENRKQIKHYKFNYVYPFEPISFICDTFQPVDFQCISIFSFINPLFHRLNNITLNKPHKYSKNMSHAYKSKCYFITNYIFLI